MVVQNAAVVIGVGPEKGLGAALAMSFAEISVRILMEMATFTEAGVAEKGE